MFKLMKTTMITMFIGAMLWNANAAWEGGALITNIFIGDYGCTNGDMVAFQLQGQPDNEYYGFYTNSEVSKAWLSQILVAKSSSLKIRVDVTDDKCVNAAIIKKIWVY